MLCSTAKSSRSPKTVKGAQLPLHALRLSIRCPLMTKSFIPETPCKSKFSVADTVFGLRSQPSSALTSTEGGAMHSYARSPAANQPCKLDRGCIDTFDETEGDEVQALIWCDTHRQFHWRWVPKEWGGQQI